MPRHLDDSKDMTDRDLVRDTRTRVGASANSFDLFTIALTGSVFNGEERVVDKSGGLIGRMDARIKILEAGFKAHTRMLLMLGVMILLMTGVEKAKTVIEFLDKVRAAFGL